MTLTPFIGGGSGGDLENATVTLGAAVGDETSSNLSWKVGRWHQDGAERIAMARADLRLAALRRRRDHEDRAVGE